MKPVLMLRMWSLLKKATIAGFLAVGICLPVLCQVTISGRVVDAEGKPVPYANIGILDTGTGTISNEDGSFAINIPPSQAKEKLFFSAVGYNRKAIPLTSLQGGKAVTIQLTEKVTELKTVMVTGKRGKKKSITLGHRKSLLLSGQLYFDTISAGSAMALLIDNRKFPEYTFAEKASLWIAKNKSPQFKVRLRFLEVDSAHHNQPGKDIFDESIVLTSDIGKGWLEFDLSSYRYRINSPSFYLMFEWILEDKDRRYIAGQYAEYKKLHPDRVSYDTVVVDGERVPIAQVNTVVAGTVFGVTTSKSSLKNNTCFYRTNSFGEWKRAAGVLSAKVVMSNHPPDGEFTPPIKLCPDSPLVCDIRSWAEDLMEENALPGMQLSVSKKGKLVFSEGFGYADVQNKKPVTTQTQFRIASVSKTMTSAALMKLVAANKLDLDAPVQHYVPSFPEKKFTITTRQLAGHLSGIRDYYGLSWEELFGNAHYATSKEALSIFKHDTLEAKPGSQFIYSPFGYILAGAVIEGASGQSYLGYMSTHIWKPLSMLNTYGDIADSLMENKSKFYHLSGEEAKPYDLSYGYPSGGLISTTEDLVKFGNDLLSGDLLDERLKEQLFETQYTTKGAPTHYGLGWYLGQDTNGHKVWYHAGELPSSGSMLMLYPDDAIVVSILANTPILSDTAGGFSSAMQKVGELVYQN